MADDDKPPLRDRSWFFHHLLNGDLDTYERVAPRWRDQWRPTRWAEPRRVPERSERRAVDLSDARLRPLRLQVAKDKKISRSCWWLVRSLRAARRRIKSADVGRVQDDAARAAVQQDAKDIAKRLRVVRMRLQRLRELTGPAGPFGPEEVMKLDFAGGDTSHRARRRTYKDLDAALETIKNRTVGLRRDIKARKKDLKKKERRAAG